MMHTASECKQNVLVAENRRMADMIGELRQQERRLATTIKVQRSDIDCLKKRLAQFGADNDDLLEKLAAMKCDRARRQRHLDEQTKKHAADKVRQMDNSRDAQPDNDRQLRDTTDQLTEARRNVDRLQQELNTDRKRYAELERVNVELESRVKRMQQLRLTQSLPKTAQVHDAKQEQQLKDRTRTLTRRLGEAQQRLTEHAEIIGQIKQERERLVTEKAELESKNHELSSALDNLKRNHARSEQQEKTLVGEVDRLKRAMEECSVTEDRLKKQLRSVVDKKHELEQQLEQMRSEQSGAKRTEKILRDELEEIKQTMNERTVGARELKRQLANAQESYDVLSRNTQSEIDRLKEESKGTNEEVKKLKTVNLQLANNERQLKAELEETKRKVESERGKLQQEINTLGIDLKASEEARIKLRKEHNEMLEKLVPKQHLEKVETELKQLRKGAEERRITIQKLQEEQKTLQQRAQETEEELDEQIEKLRSELKTKAEDLQNATEQSLKLEIKNEKLKQSCDEKKKLFQREHEKLQESMTEQHKAFQEKIKAKEAQHLAEKEQMLKRLNEKEKELKNKMKIKEFEIRAEIDKLKSKCKELELEHDEKLRDTDEEIKRRIKELEDEIEERNKLTEEVNRKNEELQKIIDEQQACQTNKFQTLCSENDQLKEKVGKLERAVLRLRLENDDLREHKANCSKNENVKEVATELQTTHKSDLQLQIDMLRQTVKDLSKPLAKRSPSPISDANQEHGADRHCRLLEELGQLVKSAQPQDVNGPVEDSSALASELEAERSKVRACSDRIVQLERWLDTIFNDQQLGIGPSTISGSAEPSSQVTAPPEVGTTGSNSLTTRPNGRSPTKQKQTRISKPKRR